MLRAEVTCGRVIPLWRGRLMKKTGNISRSQLVNTKGNL